MELSLDSNAGTSDLDLDRQGSRWPDGSTCPHSHIRQT